MDNKNLNKRIAKNTLFLYLRMIIVLFISIYTTRIVLDVLGVEDYGIYNVVCTFVGMFTFLNASLSNGIQRFYNYEAGKNKEDGVKKVYQASLLIQAVLAIILFLILETVGLWYINYKMVIDPSRLIAANWIFQFSILSLVMLILQIPYSAALIAYEKMDFYAMVSILDTLLKLGIILLLPYLDGDKLIIYGILTLSISIINFTLYFTHAKRNIPELSLKNYKLEKKLFKSITAFSGWNTMEMFAWMTQSQGVNMILNLFFGTIVNAARGVSGQIQHAIQGFCGNIVMAFRPQLVQSYAQGNIERTNKMMFSISKIMFLLFFVLSLPVMIEIDYVLNLWLGDNVPEYTTTFTILILLSMFPRNFVMAFSQVIHATGKMKNYQIGSTLVIIAVLPISYYALYKGYSPNSVFIINLVFCIALFVVCLLLLKKVFPVNIKAYIKEVILPCCIIFVAVPPLPIYITHLIPSSFLRLCITSAITLALAAALSYKILLNKEERGMIKKIVKK